MMRRSILLLPLLLVLTGCYKDDIDVSTWTNNPFDPDYTGPAVFSMDTTYVELAGVPPNVVSRQVFQFTVDSDLFLAPNAYQVRVTDLDNGQTALLSQYPVGSDVWRFTKIDYAFGQEVCLDVQLSNELSYGRKETICATLQ